MKFFSVIAKIFRFFSIYVDPFEKEVDLFLSTLRGHPKKKLQNLIQRDLVKLTVFLEYKFKGYKKLKKEYRKKLYENADLIARDFSSFFENRKAEIAAIQSALDLPAVMKSDVQFLYLLGIMDYLKPGLRLQYQEAATFSALLRDPASDVLVGDCNQITTLYIYLFSLRFPVKELRVKILAGHVCLHYRGIDIETTSGALAEYHDYIFLSEVEEIVASNLLDIADPSEKQFEISPENMLKSAHLAFHFSGHRKTVEKNLFTAYHNMAVFHIKRKNHRKAILFANKSGDTKLQRQVVQHEALEHLKAKRYEKALERFRKINDANGEKACYQNQLVDFFERIKSFKTLNDFKSQKGTLIRMRELALKLDNRKAVDYVNDILRKLV